MAYSSKWIPNEIFMVYKGVTIYYTYRYNEHSRRRWSSFGTTPETRDGGDPTNFWVEDLPTWKKDQPQTGSNIRKAIREAIDSGDLQPWLKAAKIQQK